jgi:hypothetical protein
MLGRFATCYSGSEISVRAMPPPRTMIKLGGSTNKRQIRADTDHQGCDEGDETNNRGNVHETLLGGGGVDRT